jgi:TetR/AcrR family transcriptional repressor of nem operon
LGRHQSFDRDKVLESAMRLFWQKGYRQTSMSDLEKATGLNPGSLYNAFDSKKGLFVSAIEFYTVNFVGNRIASVLMDGEPLDAIERFFRSSYEGLPRADLLGCLLTNTATEVGADDPEVSRAVGRGVDRIEAALCDRLAEAQKAGRLSKDKNPAALAGYLLSCYQGMSVLGRLTRDPKRLATIADAALETLH